MRRALPAAILLAMLALPLRAPAAPPTLRVASDAEFEAAVSALRDSGGTVLMLPRSYGDLVVPARSTSPLRIEAERGTRAERVLFDHTQRVTLTGLTVTPETQDAWIELLGSSNVELDAIQVTAAGTRHLAEVLDPDSRDVVIRDSSFAHCGDRSPEWANCLLLSRWAHGIDVEHNRFHDCFGCDFIHGRFGSDLTIRGNSFDRALPCHIGPVRCGHQDLIEMFLGQRLLVDDNHFGLYELGGAQLYLTNAIDHVRIVNNVFLGTDPRVPDHHALVGLIVGSSGSRRLPHDVEIVNNTILSGARRPDGFLGSVRMSSLYGSLPRRERPLLVNNVIGVLASTWPVCKAVRHSISNVVVQGRPCSPTDRVGDPRLDRQGRPTEASTLLIARANRRYAPPVDIRGRARGRAPDIGAYQH